MAVYECNACSANEVTGHFVPDCCSVCGSSISLISGHVIAAENYEAFRYAAEDAAYVVEDIIDAGERQRAFLANGLFLILAAMILLGSIGPSSDVMAACETTHSYDTCFSTLNR